MVIQKLYQVLQENLCYGNSEGIISPRHKFQQLFLLKKESHYNGQKFQELRPKAPPYHVHR